MSISENEGDIDGCIAEESAVALLAIVAAEREHEAYGRVLRVSRFRRKRRAWLV
jgi:hypothetical protein